MSTFSDDKSAPSDAGAAKEHLQDLRSGPETATKSGTNNMASGEKDIHLVNWDGPEDPENPQNFPRWRKWTITWLFSSLTVWVTFSSSVFASTAGPTSKLFHVSAEVMILGVSMSVLGFATGPLVWGPMSEVWGRRVPLFAGYFIFVIFQIPVALAQNLETVLVCRFFSGFFGTSSLAVIGGALVDFWGPVDRAVAISMYSAATFLGPIMGPIVGGFVTSSYLGWRWTAWFTMIPAAAFGLIAFFLVPETYHPLLLQRRAARLRKETRDSGYYSLLDKKSVTIRDVLVNYLFRPCAMLVMEPILLLITIYISLIYGILYLFFVAYPISFDRVRAWNNIGLGALPLLAVLIGVCIGAGLVSLYSKVWYAQKLTKTGKVVPEDRLPPMMIGAVVLPIGLFWFAWTSNPHVSWVAQTFAGIPIGAGIIAIWMQGLNYVIDVYTLFANSAISGNTLIRSMVGAGFPLFAVPMFDRLGVAWATSLLAFLSVAMIPIPFVFQRFGAHIRALSRYSPKL